MNYGSALPMGWRERHPEAEPATTTAQSAYGPLPAVCQDDGEYRVKFALAGAVLGMMLGGGMPRKKYKDDLVVFQVGILAGMVAGTGVGYLLRPTRQECKL